MKMSLPHNIINYRALARPQEPLQQKLFEDNGESRKMFLALRRHMVNNLYKSYERIPMCHLKTQCIPLLDDVFWEGQKHSCTIINRLAL